MIVGNIEDAEPFVTKDGSSIREAAGPVSLPAANQSLAEATVAPGATTQEHYHRITEELYWFTSGMGTMIVDGQERDVRPATASSSRPAPATACATPAPSRSCSCAAARRPTRTTTR